MSWVDHHLNAYHGKVRKVYCSHSHDDMETIKYEHCIKWRVIFRYKLILVTTRWAGWIIMSNNLRRKHMSTWNNCQQHALSLQLEQTKAKYPNNTVCITHRVSKKIYLFSFFYREKKFIERKIFHQYSAEYIPKTYNQKGQSAHNCWTIEWDVFRFKCSYYSLLQDHPQRMVKVIIFLLANPQIASGYN